MRKVLFMMMAVLLTACSVTDDDKARKLIDAYMQKNANDPSSVEIIEVENAARFCKCVQQYGALFISKRRKE